MIVGDPGPLHVVVRDAASNGAGNEERREQRIFLSFFVDALDRLLLEILRRRAEGLLDLLLPEEQVGAVRKTEGHLGAHRRQPGRQHAAADEDHRPSPAADDLPDVIHGGIVADAGDIVNDNDFVPKKLLFRHFIEISGLSVEPHRSPALHVIADRGGLSDADPALDVEHLLGLAGLPELLADGCCRYVVHLALLLCENGCGKAAVSFWLWIHCAAEGTGSAYLSVPSPVSLAAVSLSVSPARVAASVSGPSGSGAASASASFSFISSAEASARS